MTILRALQRALLVLAVSCVGAGCPETGGETPTPTCPAGDENCPCNDDGSCRDGLTCTQNVCIPETVCSEGDEGCPCYVNNTCNDKDGVPMECVDGTCVATSGGGQLGDACDTDNPCGKHTDGTQLECTSGTCQLPCDAGTLNCPCDTGDVCGEHEGAQLECLDGLCRLPGCVAGTLDCPCGTGGVCGEHEGTQLECQGSTCVLPTCPEGTEGCPCGAGESCDPGLACQAGTCEVGTLDEGVTVGSADVRACTVVIEVPDVTVTFSGDVVGRAKRDGSRLAFSFTAKTDAALSAVVATILGGDGQAADVSAVTPELVECFDRLGAEVAAPELTL